MMRRAVDTEDKQTRRTSILRGARTLFKRNDGRLPTAAEVATAAGLAKGTVYLYFKTKEEIFANVLLEGWLPVLQATELVFKRSKGKRLDQAHAFIASIVDHLGKHPELLRLDTLSAGVLEKNMTPEALVEYKHRFNQGLIEAGDCIDRALRLQPGRGVQILVRTYALTRGLWQTAQHAEGMETLNIGIPHKLTASTFLDELSAALWEYWRGALS
jgi:TetR/AcrR family transcriptional regulator